jgi:uncharacterized C2H2 Zn-finger protein
LTAAHAILAPYFTDIRKKKIVFELPHELKLDDETKPEIKYKNGFPDTSNEKMVCFVKLEEINQEVDLNKKLNDMKLKKKQCWNLYTTERIKCGHLERQVKLLKNEKSLDLNVQQNLEKQLSDMKIHEKKIDENLKLEIEKGEAIQVELEKQENSFKTQIIHLQNQIDQLQNALQTTITERNDMKQLLATERDQLKIVREELEQHKLEKIKFQEVLSEINFTSNSNEEPKADALKNLVESLNITPNNSADQSNANSQITTAPTNHETTAPTNHETTAPTNHEIKFETRFYCPTCNTEFKQRSDYNRHYKEIHEETSKFQCEICQRVFKARRYLIDHINQKHLKVKIYSCKICRKEFQTKSARDSHRRHCNK